MTSSDPAAAASEAIVMPVSRAVVENASIRNYLEAMPFLSEAEVRQTVAAIATSEAGHAALFRAELGRPPVPDAFVTGRSQKG